jgi:hypothetical protein
MTDESKPAKKIAVVAVHGISDQKPYESARAIADLLLNTTHQESEYAPFKECHLRIKVTPVKIEKDVTKKVENNTNFLSKVWHSANERGPNMEMLLADTYPQNKESSKSPEYDFDFIKDKIGKYKQQSVYESICLKGKRTSKIDPSPKTPVHIYEMYWGDLSRLGSGFIRIVGEFYQLLFHLSSIGRLSVDWARAENQHNSQKCCFTTYSEVQIWADRFLSLVLPILNLCLLVAASISFVGKIPLASASFIASGSIGLVAALAIGCYFLRINVFVPKQQDKNTQRNDFTFCGSWILTLLLGLFSFLGIHYYFLKNPFLDVGHLEK